MNEPALWGLQRKLLDLGAKLGLAHPVVGADELVLAARSGGTSLCSACHPPAYVHRKLGADFDLVAFPPGAEDGRPDMHLFRKPAVIGVFTGQPS